MQMLDAERIDDHTFLEFGEKNCRWYLVQYGTEGTETHACVRVSVDYLTAEDARNAHEFGTVDWEAWD